MNPVEDELNQTEIDELINSIQGEELPEEEEAAPEPIQTPEKKTVYRIGLEERIVRKRMPTLDIINERFSRVFREKLFNFIRESLEVVYDSLKIKKYSEMTSEIGVPANVNMITIRPLRGHALVILDTELVFFLIDTLFGGTGEFKIRIEGRDFTHTELRIINKILDVFFDCYQSAWENIYNLSLEFVRSETHFHMTNIATPNEIVIWSSFRVDLARGGGYVHVCIPYIMVEPIREILYSSFSNSQVDPNWSNLLRSEIKYASVRLHANLTKKKITIGELVKLKKGDIIPVDINSCLPVEINGIQYMTAKYGTLNSHYALKIEEITPPTIDPDR